MSIFNGNEIADPVATMVERRAAQPNMATHLNNLNRLYIRNPWHEYLSYIAVHVEPIDRTLGRDKNAPSAHAFLNGGLLAVDVTYRCLPNEVTKTMLKIGLGGDDTEEEDLQIRVHKVAESIIDSGDYGYSLSPELAEVIDSWEDEISPEVRYQPFIKRGFGAVMYLAHAACDIVSTAELMKADRDGVDWDAELTAILQPPSVS